MTSPYFNAMFGPSSTFSEREKLTQASISKLSERPIITLYDDSALAMKVVFWVMHGKNHLVRNKLGLELLVEVASMVEKYRLWNCLGLWTERWVRELGEVKLGPETVNYL